MHRFREAQAGATQRVGHLGRMPKGKGVLENELELLCHSCGEKGNGAGGVSRSFQAEKNAILPAVLRLPFQAAGPLRAKTMHFSPPDCI